jgi:hypothetical protein
MGRQASEEVRFEPNITHPTIMHLHDDLYQWESLLETHAEKTILLLQGVPDTLHIHMPRFAHAQEDLGLTSCIAISTL